MIQEMNIQGKERDLAKLNKSYDKKSGIDVIPLEQTNNK